MGSPVQVLDGYYLAITLLVTVGYQLSGFGIAWTFQVIDIHGHWFTPVLTAVFVSSIRSLTSLEVRERLQLMYGSS